MNVPITSDLSGYATFWDRWLKVLVVLASLWGVVLEGTLLSIRAAVEPVVIRTPTPTLYVSESFASAAIDARSLWPAASLLPSKSPHPTTWIQPRSSVPETIQTSSWLRERARNAPVR